VYSDRIEYVRFRGRVGVEGDFAIPSKVWIMRHDDNDYTRFSVNICHNLRRM